MDPREAEAFELTDGERELVRVACDCMREAIEETAPWLVVHTVDVQVGPCVEPVSAA